MGRRGGKGRGMEGGKGGERRMKEREEGGRRGEDGVKGRERRMKEREEGGINMHIKCSHTLN